MFCTVFTCPFSVNVTRCKAISLIEPVGVCRNEARRLLREHQAQAGQVWDCRTGNPDPTCITEFISGRVKVMCNMMSVA